MTIRELLCTPLMKDAEVIAGENGLDSEVTWCAPDIALKFDNWIMPGILMLYTGTYETLSWRECLDTILKKSRISGMLLFGGKSATFIEERDFPYFNELSLPLIRMPKAVNPLSFSKRFASVASNFFETEHRRSEWLRELCSSGSFPGGETSAEAYGYSSDANYCCVLVKAYKLENPSLLQIEMHFTVARDILSRDLAVENFQVLSFIDSQSLTVFVPWPRTQGIGVPYDRIRTVARRLRDNITRCKWVFSVGTTAGSLSEFCLSYHNAQQTSGVIAALKAHEEVSFYDDWYLHLLLLKEPKAELRAQMERSLKPILEVPELIETLCTYLTFGENLKVTSEKLYIHVNTLKYRLQKISDLLNCDLKDPNVRFRLRMAITIERYLGHD